MILQTVYPLEIVLQGFESTEYSFMDMECNGVHMQVEPINPHQARIVRLYHAPLHHYLNPLLQPGQIIEFTPSVMS